MQPRDLVGVRLSALMEDSQCRENRRLSFRQFFNMKGMKQSGSLSRSMSSVGGLVLFDLWSKHFTFDYSFRRMRQSIKWRRHHSLQRQWMTCRSVCRPTERRKIGRASRDMSPLLLHIMVLFCNKITAVFYFRHYRVIFPLRNSSIYFQTAGTVIAEPSFWWEIPNHEMLSVVKNRIKWIYHCSFRLTV